MSELVLRAQSVRKTFDSGPAEVTVLRDVNLQVARGERLAVLGRSGSGKSTLLHILGGLDDPDSGEVWVGQESLQSLSVAQRARLRNHSIGFIYQFHHLLPEFSAHENVAMPLLLAGINRAESFDRANKLLSAVGLDKRVAHRPHALSGGERQRVAVARALVANPLLVLADEPTGNLDRQSADEVFDLMCSLSDQFGTSFLIVTHDESMLQRTHRALKLVDGALQPFAAEPPSGHD